MKKNVFFHNLTTYAWKRICQQFWLLAVLSMLFFVLPLCAGPVAEEILTSGVEFSGLHLAVCAPEGDATGQLLEELTGNMRDISRYASFHSMTWEEANAALEEGRVSAALVLPENFVGGVLNGTNPDVILVVRGDRPLESLLTLWVGQSAADLLTSAQRGIYAVLELYPGEGIPELSWEQVKLGINMEYISATLNRQKLFRTTTLKATDTMDISDHYGLSLLLFLAMTLPTLFYPLFSGEDMAFRRRVKSLGYGAAVQLGSCLIVIFSVLAVMIGPASAYLTGGNVPGALAMAVFCSAYCGFCCLAVSSSAGCAGLSFSVAGFMLFASGGVLPSPLLPDAVRWLGALLPAGLLRSQLYLSPEEWGNSWIGTAVWTAVLLAASLLLYRKKLNKGEGSA